MCSILLVRTCRKYIYHGSNILSTESDFNVHIRKAWTTIDRLKTMWTSDHSNRIKRGFFQALSLSVLLHGCTIWLLMKCLEKKLDKIYTWMLRSVLNKFKKQHPTKQKLCGHLPLITQTILVRRSRHTGENRDKLLNFVLLWTPIHGQISADHRFISSLQRL